MAPRPHRGAMVLLVASIASVASLGAAPPRSEADRAGARFAALSARQRAPGHAFVAEGGGLRARVGADAQVTLSGGRAEITRRGLVVGVRTEHVGREGAQRAAPPVAAVRAEGQEAVLARGGVEERYLAGPLGLEQSFRVDERPGGAGLLAIEVAFDGLAPGRAAADQVQLRDEAGVARAVYRDLAAVDARGRDLPAHLKVDGARVTLVIDDAGAVYPVTVDPLIAVQQAEIFASNGAQYDRFGGSVSLSGDTALVGAYGVAGNTGAVYVLGRSGAMWSPAAELAASEGAPEDLFGYAAGLSGDTAVIGAYGSTGNRGAAYVFVRSGATWTRQAKLVAADGKTNDRLGLAVSVSGDTAVVGACPDTYAPGSGPGGAYVFTRTGASWAQQAKLVPTGPGSKLTFGCAVSVSNDTIAVGSPDDASDRGAAYVFSRSGVTWAQQAKLVGSDSAALDFLGTSVSVSGDTVLVGSNRGDTTTAGAYVFVRSGATWTEQAKLFPGDPSAADLFGCSASLDGDTAVLGASGADSNTGAAYVFSRSGGTWSQTAKPVSSDSMMSVSFGVSVSVSGATVVVGAPTGLVAPSSAGIAYAFLIAGADGDPCGAATECASGFCVDGVCCDTACGGATNDCQACSQATGAAADGTCGPVPDDRACDDGDACTQLDACQSGACVGGDPKDDGAPCDDGDACTQVDACHGGACVGTSPVVCAAPDECHAAGACDAATGACSITAKADGTPCAAGACEAGVCMPTAMTSGGTGGGGSGGSGSGGSGSGGGRSFVLGGCHAARGATGEGALGLVVLAAGLAAARRRARRGA